MNQPFSYGYALLVGVGASSYAPWSLPMTVSDAAALRQTLVTPGLCAWPDDDAHIRLLSDGAATRQAIQKGLTWLAAQAAADADDSGHGECGPFCAVPRSGGCRLESGLNISHRQGGLGNGSCGPGVLPLVTTSQGGKQMFPTSFHTSDGLSLTCYGELPATGTPQGQVILLHGLGDHSRSLPYRNLAEFLGGRGWAVYGYDWRGHGRSDGLRMFTPSWQQLRDDLHRFVGLVREQTPNGPLFLVGLSLGGLLALNYAQHHPEGLDGVVVAAPAVDASGVPLPVKLVVPLLSRLLPKASLNPGLDLAHIARDANAVREYTGDPLFQTSTTPRLAAEVLTAMAETRAQAPLWRLPLLILHGEADTIVLPQGSARFFEQITASDKERRSYPDAYHNLFIDSNRGQVFADIADWLARH